MKQLIPALYVVGGVMTLVGAAVYITGWELSPYSFAWMVRNLTVTR